MTAEVQRSILPIPEGGSYEVAAMCEPLAVAMHGVNRADVKAGDKVKRGGVILTLEAMKMETGLHADRAAVIKAVHVVPGAQIDAKDLMVELE